MRWLAGPTDSIDMSLSKLREMDRDAWHTTVHEIAELDMTLQLNKSKIGLKAVLQSPHGQQGTSCGQGRLENFTNKGILMRMLTPSKMCGNFTVVGGLSLFVLIRGSCSNLASQVAQW